MKIVGHRGAKGEAPENTLPSFKHAYGQGIRHFELDVRLSSDGELMTIHDKTTDRTTGLSGNVAELTAKQLTSIDAGKNIPPWYEPAPIPTLTSVLNACQDFLSIQLDVKTDSNKTRLNHLCTRLTDLIKERNLYDRATITSSDTWVLQQIKYLDRSIQTGYIARNSSPDPVQTALKFNCGLLVLNYKLASEAIVKDCVKASLEISCWTVNTLPEILALQALGIKNLITDYPTLVIKYYQRQHPGIQVKIDSSRID